jgi:hypothetical protein
MAALNWLKTPVATATRMREHFANGLAAASYFALSGHLCAPGLAPLAQWPSLLGTGNRFGDYLI